MDEAELVRGLLAGEEAAYRQAVSAYHGLMQHVARAIVGESICEEVVQDAWLAVLRALPGFEARSSLRTWILQIVSNAARTRLRRERRFVAVGDAGDVELAASQRFHEDGHWSEPPAFWHLESPERMLESVQLQQAIDVALENLPELQRAVLSLRDMQGMEVAEICKILDLTESNCRVLLHRARLRVWQAIEQFQQGKV